MSIFRTAIGMVEPEITPDNTYPIIVYPPAIKTIMSELPSIPNLPIEPTLNLQEKPILELPNQPSLILPDKPQKQIVHKPLNPGLFAEKSPKKIFSKKVVILPTLSLLPIISIFLAKYFNINLGILTFITSILILVFLIFNESQNENKFHVRKSNHAKAIEQYNQELIKWEAQQKEVEFQYQESIREWEKQVNHKKIIHEQEIIQWQSTIKNLQTKYNQELEEWEKFNNAQRAAYRIKYDSWKQEIQKLEKLYRTPIKTIELRALECQKKIKYLTTRPLNGNANEDKRGYAEYPENCIFSTVLKNYFSDEKIHILKLLGNYTPDFAYIDQENNLYIDIEIDEPYTPRQYSNNSQITITHYLGADDRRNQYFINSGWIVVRFSEFQVLHYPHRCCNYLAELIYIMTGNEYILKKSSNDGQMPVHRIWSYQDAENMASSGIRKTNYKIVTTKFMRYQEEKIYAFFINNKPSLNNSLIPQGFITKVNKENNINKNISSTSNKDEKPIVVPTVQDIPFTSKNARRIIRRGFSKWCKDHKVTNETGESAKIEYLDSIKSGKLAEWLAIKENKDKAINQFLKGWNFEDN